MKNKIHIYILAHDRPKVLKQSLNSLSKSPLFKKASILIDYPELNVEEIISNFILDNKHIDIEALPNPRLKGNIMAYIYKEIFNSDNNIVGIIETDYIFRPQYLEEIKDIFEYYPNTLSICGYHHPDTQNPELTFKHFPEITKKFFGKDIDNRDKMYQPFETIINNKKYLLQGVSNHTGCHFINCKVLKEVLKDNLEDFLNFITDLAAAPGICDGRLCSAYQIYWEKWAKNNNLDMSINFPILDICDYSISNHYGGGGLCVGGIDGEMVDWIKSPTWESPDKIINR